MTDLTVRTLGVLALMGGLYGLLWCWRNRRRAHGLQLALSWLALFVAIGSWGAAGLDRGVAVIITLMTALPVLLFMAIWHLGMTPAYVDGYLSPGTGSTQTRAPGRSLRRGLRRFMAFLLAGPLAGAAAVLLAALMFKLLLALGGSPANAGAYVLLGGPLIWAGLSVYLLYEPSLLRRTLVCLGLGLIGAVSFII